MARYCVIGEVGINRKWFSADTSHTSTDARYEAREHAKTLIAQSKGITKELLIVKVVDVVRVTEPPIGIYVESD